MKAFVKSPRNGRHYIIEGNREDFSENFKIVAEGSTRREAIRRGKDAGYEIVIKNRVKAAIENDKTSLLDRLATAQQRVAAQRPKPAPALSKSKPSALDL